MGGVAKIEESGPSRHCIDPTDSSLLGGPTCRTFIRFVFAAKMAIEVAPDPAAESMIEGYETGQERGCRVQFPHTRRVDGALGDSDRE